jgi:hypothetical protein
MSDFFQSELVRGDIQKMMELQQFCFRSAMNFVLLDKDRKLEYFDALETLIEKQKVFYYRIKLSDDPEARSVLETMQQGIVMLGATAGTTVEEMFDELIEKVGNMRSQLESGTGG